MKTIYTMLLSFGVVASLVSCDSKNENPQGNWKSSAPVSVTEKIDGASSAVESLSFDFKVPAEGTTGVVTLTADYDVTLAQPADSAASAGSYKVTASVNGTWTQDADDSDDYLLSFDQNSLSVAGTDAPELGPVTDVFLNSLAKFTTIEDVEVSKDGTHLTFETKNPEVKYHFVKK